MNATRRLLAQQHQHQPLIRFIGKHFPPKQVDHAPQAHPASPTHSLPDSFAAYRSRAQQHGPLNHRSSSSPSSSSSSSFMGAGLGHIGSHSGHDLGPVAPGRGEFFDRNELPDRFRRSRLVWAEIEAVESGGASLY